MTLTFDLLNLHEKHVFYIVYNLFNLFLSQKRSIWKFTIFDLRRSFSKVKMTSDFQNRCTYLESSRQDASYCMVKCLRKSKLKNWRKRQNFRRPISRKQKVKSKVSVKIWVFAYGYERIYPHAKFQPCSSNIKGDTGKSHENWALIEGDVIKRPWP